MNNQRTILQTGMALGLALLLHACKGAAESPTPAGTTMATAPAVESTVEPTVPQATRSAYAEQRERLVQQGVIGWGIEDERVIEAMRSAPRHAFVPEDYLNQAYENHPLPIGYGQTISQPYIVALMTQELDLEAGAVVLEIGTGSGYQAAVLAELGLEVYTMEIIEPLAEAAEARLARLGYENVEVKHADGYTGWEEHAPYDAIIVTAAPDHVPQPLLSQLKIGGVMVIPVGPVGGYQELWRITRVDETSFARESLGGVRFVPLTRQEGAE
jgi:protein-L-isoaspartate(D-aspartate) O-methyltransferase